jgi:3-phosphoglycerate kinase
VAGRIDAIGDLKLDGRTVLCRVDFNVPLKNGAITDDTRIRAALPTIAALRDAGAKVVLCSHLGRPDGERKPEFSLLPVAERLATLIDTEVVFSHDTVGDEVLQLVKEQPPRAVILLENLRYDAREEDGDAAFARQLAALGDVFVNDAFGAMHRAHASITGVPQFVPSAVGLLVQKELQALEPLVDPDAGLDRKPFAAILGGAKVSDKIGVIEALSKRVDHLFVGGAMAYTFLAAQGQPTGTSKIEKDKLDLADKLLQKCAARGVRVHLPTDHVVAQKFAADAPTEVVSEIPEGSMGLDIGPATLAAWIPQLERCNTVLWNGPTGVFEWDSAAAGTRAVAQTLGRMKHALTVVGGGDSAAAAVKFGVQDEVSHVSTGGGASLEFLEHGDLVGVAALRRK